MRGGERPDAGRRRHVPNKASAAREQEAQASGETPADVWHSVMREFLRLAKNSTHARRRGEHLRAAAVIARDAAPYFHARRISAPVAVGDGVTEVIHRVEVIGGLARCSAPEFLRNF